MATRGRFISLDGLDGTGKSTQCRLLADWLRSAGIQLVECREPGGTSLGEAVREILLDRRQEISPPAEALLFSASRSELVSRVIRPTLDLGHWVLSDRFFLATIVYQGHAGGVDVSDLKQLSRFATCGLEPDLTLILDVPVDVAIRRRGREADRMENRDRTFHECVRRGFLTEAGLAPERHAVVDASGAVEEVQRRIRSTVSNRLNIPQAR